MLPSIEQVLITDRGFKRLALSAFGKVIKDYLDSFTIPIAGKTAIANYADVKLLEFLRGKMRTGSMQNHAKPEELNPIYVTGVLSLFSDSAEDTIEFIDITAEKKVVDWDKTKPILMTKIRESGYLYGLAECTAEDFAKDQQDEEGAWIMPV